MPGRCPLCNSRAVIAFRSAVPPQEPHQLSTKTRFILWHTKILDGQVSLCKCTRHTRSCRTCLTNWSIKKYKDRLPTADDSIYSGVEEQLRSLGGDHVGYTHKQFKAADGTPFAIVGGRPFSKVHLGGHAICCRVNVTKALHTVTLVAALIFKMSCAGSRGSTRM